VFDPGLLFRLVLPWNPYHTPGSSNPDCYLRLGRNADAVKLLELACEADPDDRAVDYALGTALIRDGQAQKGERERQTVLRLNQKARQQGPQPEPRRRPVGSSLTCRAQVSCHEYSCGCKRDEDVPEVSSQRCTLTSEAPGCKLPVGQKLKTEILGGTFRLTPRPGLVCTHRDDRSRKAILPLPAPRQVRAGA